MKQPSILLAGIACLLLSGCLATHERPLNQGERTALSNDVAALLEEDFDGEIDIREEPEIRCVRHKRVGTHMVTRHCYTLGEQEQMARQSQDGVRDRFAKQPCLDSSSLACKQGSAFSPRLNGGGGPNRASAD